MRKIGPDGPPTRTNVATRPRCFIPSEVCSERGKEYKTYLGNFAIGSEEFKKVGIGARKREVANEQPGRL